jgi:hypothetical protein
MPKCRAVWLIVLFAICCMAGCGGSGQTISDPTVTPPATVASSTTTTQSATAATTAPTPSNTVSVSGTTSDEQGDRAVVTVAVASPQPLETTSDPVARACDQEVTNSGRSLSSAVAIPIHVTAELTSSIKAPLNVNLSQLEYLETHGHEVELLNHHTSLPVLWAAAYSNSEPQCPVVPEVQWTGEVITPHTAESWDAWLVIAGAITPNDPTGESLTSRILIRPGAGISGGNSDGDLTPHGGEWVSCSADESITGPHSEPYLAVDPTAVSHNGCTVSH